ncbi:sel1 repeat family protein [Vibrio sinaloensis]|uniref:sel1 repeat family protein n=1 Tax=Photobacterium sp. (strain ATCC 43367) TaxID=379097 RepID=UPI0022AFA378|nr:sel1 repeat family protein [Vibrio sinaloensis]MCZ4293981.1 sel1 repeat family protein [Vibrio sinaloensis]
MKQTLFIFLLLCSGKLWAISPVEQGIRLFNQKEYQQAQQIFQQQSEQGSAYATYWLGVTQYNNRQQFEAGQTFLKAAEMGSPWAMAVLAGSELNGNSPCNYLGWPCDPSWKSKAIDGWEKQAANKNGKAMFALAIKQIKWWEFIPVYKYKRHREIYEVAINNQGYGFLKYSAYWKDAEEKIKYLKIAAEQGYAPAMMSLYFYLAEPETLDEAIEWNLKAIKLGYAEAARVFYLVYSQGEKDSNGNIIIQRDVKKAYYYNRLSGALGGEEKKAYSITQEHILDEYGSPLADEDGRPVMKDLITKEEQAELDKQVAEFVKDIKPNMFLDETSLELF